MKRRAPVLLPFLFTCLLLLCRFAFAQAAQPEMLSNGGTEAPFVNGMAHNWSANCYGSNTVLFAEESTDVHGGRSAQRVTCTQFDSGGVQFHSADIAIEKGKPYTLRLWLKGTIKGPLWVGLRKHGAPYTAYLKRDVRVKNEWTPVLIIGEPTDSDPRCGLYLMFTGTGTLLVDDVSLEPGIHEDSVIEAAGPAQKGNRIYNSGFEAGPEGWTPVNGFALDDHMAHSGQFSARVETTRIQGGPGGIECRPLPVRTGRRYTLSAWIKAAQPDTRVRLRLFEWADNGGDFPQDRHERSTNVMTSTNWARYELSGILLPNLHEGYVARIVPSGRIWVDDIQVEEGDATDYQPANPLEVGAETATRWCLAGDSVEVTARAASRRPEPVTLKYTLEDLWSRPLTNLVHQAKTAEPDRARFWLEHPGIYRVRVQANDSPATGEVRFGVFPKRDRRPRPGSQFGTHVTAALAEPSHALRVSAAMGARWVRLHDFGDFCHWYVVEPEKGKFVWHDPEIGELRDNGFEIFANLGHPPRWAGRDEGKRRGGGAWTPAPPRDVSEWENYVYRTVEHYHDRIHYWEVWNEPYWIGFFTGTPEEYTALLKTAYRAIKRADPKAIVVGGCFTPTAEDWTQRVLAAGALEFMDALSYHIYWSPPLTESTNASAIPLMAQQVQRFKELIRQYGQSKPIFMSEGGIRCPPFASWLPQDGFDRSAPFGPYSGAGETLTGPEAAAGLARGMVEMLSAGVQKIFYYYTGHEKGAMPWFSAMANGYYVLLDHDGRPKPTMMAYSALESFLDGAEPVEVLRRDGLSIHLFQKDQGALAVVWSTHDRLLSAPQATIVFDLMGNKMKPPALRAGEPVYIVAPKLTPAQLKDLIR